MYTHHLKRYCFLKKTHRRQSFHQQTWVILSNRSHYLLNAGLQIGSSIFHTNTNQVTWPAFTHTYTHAHTNKPDDLASSHTHTRQVTWPVFTHTNKPGDLASFPHTHTQTSQVTWPVFTYTHTSPVAWLVFTHIHKQARWPGQLSHTLRTRRSICQ